MSDTPQEEKDPLLKKIARGFDFENLMRDSRMQEVVKELESVRADLLESFVHISSMDTQKIAEIQQRIWAIDNWQQVIANIVVEGHNAQDLFEQREPNQNNQE